MKFLNLQNKLLVVCIAFVSFLASLKASYYQSNFFPIGLTGLNSAATGSDNCPYGAILDGSLNPLWKWENNAQYPDQTERNLIFDLGVNCLGCQDANATYLVNWGNKTASNYMSKVSSPSFLEQDTSKRIYLITASYYSRPQYDSCPDTVLCSDTLPVILVSKTNAENIPASAFFRSSHRPIYGGYGSMLFSYYNESRDKGYTNIDSMWGCHGTHGENWSTYDGDEHWRAMADEAVDSFRSFFATDDTINERIWGFNLLTEDPAMYSGGSSQHYGCWAAVDRVLRGRNTEFKVPASTKSDSSGFRGVTFGDGKDRMVLAKGHVWMYASPYPSVNMFEYLPDIDVILEYNHFWHRASDNYGAQALFDRLLYGSSDANWQHPEGYHNTAVYMQRYGGTGGGPAGQKRRWMPGLCVEWRVSTIDSTKALTRRPCPPEIRCAVYLCLSRGAKGIMFHPWLNNYTDSSYEPPSSVLVPTSPALGESGNYHNVGLRDDYGYPFGMSGSPHFATHKLNNGNGDTYWHSDTTNADTTYAYLKTLIQEIKLITPTLMQLDWVNGYSLNSIDPKWASPCPHEYVMDVSGVSYMDLGLFDHPYEPIGVEYFMLVNREGIADMTNRTVTVALDAGHWPGADSLILTDIANKEHPKTLKRNDDRFVFTQVFEPGEGKLYRVAPINEPPITMLHH